MKRHAIYFALALAGRGVYPPGGAITRDAGPSLPVSHFITQVNADKSITYRLFAPDARRGLDSDWRHAGLLCLARHDQGQRDGVWTWKSEPMKPQSL
ncbi:putative xylanase [Klebsiella pneumoniae]|uniref:Putative xylanase n=1 Tax=Klebsiella pneumoniae TaxID=573 RepID=A0A2X3I9E9_KLEPN|nr:putative xylanase [Klebsiella pneumoniae]